jgi:hypothetical protein
MIETAGFRTGTAGRGGAVVLVAVATLTLASCSSSTSAQHSSPTTNRMGNSSTVGPATASTLPETGLVADPLAAAQIKAAYAKLFDSTTPEAESLALLQDGAAFKDAIDAQAKSPLAQGATATVSTVTLQTPNTAKVIFTISVHGSAVLPNSPGFAVRENGIWKVAGQTFCALLTAQGAAPPACSTAAATSLPQ